MEESSETEVAVEVFPYLREYRDGRVERLVGTEVVSAGLDAGTGVESKDIVIIPGIGVSARLYRPVNTKSDQKLPLVVYFHGGAFCISSPADPLYHKSINDLVAEAKVVVVSVNYRLAPEHPLPVAYEDSWSALEWVASQSVADAESTEPWLKENADFGRIFLGGDSCGANISHHLAMKIKESELTQKLKIIGIALLYPYFWGEIPVGLEATDPVRKGMVDGWWAYVCPSKNQNQNQKPNDDLLINPFSEGAPSLSKLGCEKVLIFVAEKDILRDRGKLYYENLLKSEWKGKAELIEIEEEDHDFHIFNPNCERAKNLIKALASLFNQ